MLNTLPLFMIDTSCPDNNAIKKYSLLFGVLALLVSIPLACSFGSISISFTNAISILTGTSFTTPSEVPQDVLKTILIDLRLPRVLLALCTGASMAIAGCIFQSILGNPLADPFTLGVSSGAAFGASVAISYGFAGALMGNGLPIAALLGASCSLFFVLSLSKSSSGFVPHTLILAGIVVSAFLSALITLIKALNEDSVSGIVFWIMGSFQGRGFHELVIILPGFLLASSLSLLLCKQLDLLSLGDQRACLSGLETSKIRFLFMLTASVMTASCVSVTGIIGFIGLIVPHLCRIIIGKDAKILLPISALVGSILLIWSDVVARSIFSDGVELPVGVITALLGGPFFCFLLKKNFRIQQQEEVKTTEKAVTIPTSLVCFPQTSKPCISLSNVTVTYSGRHTPAIHNISLDIQQGEFVGILGPNGSGKSTFLSTIAGIAPKHSGSILLLGEEATTLSRHQKALYVSMMLQDTWNIPDFSVFSFVMTGRYAHTSFLRKYTRADKRIVEDSLRETASFHLKNRMISTLSGGELQRVLLAKALSQNTPILLLDEPTSNLDPAVQRIVMQAVYARSKLAKITVIAAMHDLNLASMYCSKLIFIKKGAIVVQGSSQEVFTQSILEEVYETPVTVIEHPVHRKKQYFFK